MCTNSYSTFVYHNCVLGAAFVFQTFDSGVSWTQLSKILAYDGMADDFFGSNGISLYEDVLMVGAEKDGDFGDDSGTVRRL